MDTELHQIEKENIDASNEELQKEWDETEQELSTKETD